MKKSLILFSFLNTSAQNDANGNEQSTKLSGGFTFAGSAGFQLIAYEIGFKYETASVTGGSISKHRYTIGLYFLIACILYLII
jgi:hypothetical protein